METYHTCDHIINEIIAINSCPGNCNIHQKEKDKCNYYDYRWYKDEYKYTVSGMRNKRLNFETFVMFLFVQDVNRKMKDIQFVRITKDLKP